MRTTLLTLTALAGLFGAGAASATPRLDAHQAAVQLVEYDGAVDQAEYYGDRGYGGRDWRGREEWRRREWERHRHWEEWRRFHHGW